MTDEQYPDPNPDTDLSRRRWLLRLGELVALAGVSGLVPETAASLLAVAQDAEPAATALPPAGTTPHPPA